MIRRVVMFVSCLSSSLGLLKNGSLILSSHDLNVIQLEDLKKNTGARSLHLCQRLDALICISTGIFNQE